MGEHPVITGPLLRRKDAAAWAELRAVVAEEGGNLCAVARRLGVHWRTAYYWRDNIPGVRALVDKARGEPTARTYALTYAVAEAYLTVEADSPEQAQELAVEQLGELEASPCKPYLTSIEELSR